MTITAFPIATSVFETYIAGRPDAKSSAAKMLMIQDGAIVLGAQETSGAITVMMVDCTSAPATFLIPSTGQVRLIKTDDTGHVATIQPTDGAQTIMWTTEIYLTARDETITLQLEGTNWYQV